MLVTVSPCMQPCLFHGLATTIVETTVAETGPGCPADMSTSICPDARLGPELPGRPPQSASPEPWPANWGFSHPARAPWSPGPRPGSPAPDWGSQLPPAPWPGNRLARSWLQSGSQGDCPQLGTSAPGCSLPYSAGTRFVVGWKRGAGTHTHFARFFFPS